MMNDLDDLPVGSVIAIRPRSDHLYRRKAWGREWWAVEEYRDPAVGIRDTTSESIQANFPDWILVHRGATR